MSTITQTQNQQALENNEPVNQSMAKRARKKRKDFTHEEVIVKSVVTDEQDGEDVDFILETGVYEFKPTYSSWNEVPKHLKPYYGVIWDVFSTCARCIIHRHMEMKKSSTVQHVTVGSCIADIFYVMLIQSEGKLYQWYQDVTWNGIKRRQNCIQFRFNNCLPSLDTWDDWGDFEVTHTNNTSKFGTRICVQSMKIEYISLTCNVETHEVYASFKIKKEIDTSMNKDKSQRLKKRKSND